MLFKYSVRDEKGELSVGQIEAGSREAAISSLQTRGLFVISLEEVEKKPWYSSVLDFFNRVKRKDLVVFTRQLSTLLDAHVAIDKAISSLAKQTENTVLKSALEEITSDIQEGLSFSQAIAKHPNIFDDFYVNMIRSAEISGRIEQTVDYLADYLEREWALSKKLVNALIYPVFVVVLFIVVVLIATVVVVPQLSFLFAESNVSLPWMTKILIGLGHLIIYWGWGILILLLILSFLFWRYFQTEEGKTVVDEIKLKIPIIDLLLKKIYIARFTEGAAVLIRGGISVPTSLEMAGKITANYIYRAIAFELADGVRRGESLSDILEKYPDYFPPLVVQMVSVGEVSGKLDELLEKIASFYKQEIELRLSTIDEMLQPVLIVILGVFVGFLVASILFPIYNLIQSI